LAKLSPEFKIGSLVLAGLVLLILGINYLKGFNPFAPSTRYYARYAKIDGLSVSNPVLVNGFKVGQVTSVKFSEQGDGTLIVAFDIEETGLRITEDAKARIFSSDLFGTKAIELIAGTSNKLAAPGDTLTSETEVGIAEAVRIELMPLKNKTDQLIESVDDILTNFKAVFEDDAVQGLPTAFASLQRTITTLEHTSRQLDGMVTENRSAVASVMRNVNEITTTLKDNDAAISNVIRNFSDVSDSLAAINFAATIGRADAALASVADISARIQRGEGSLGELLASDSLHDGLVETNRQLQFLVNDLYLNPWRYVKVSVFGKKDEKKLSEAEEERLRNMIDQQLDARAPKNQP
jgi:phospholipid/cholesterol/gamma-HCH transport system substrate-binding protein